MNLVPLFEEALEFQNFNGSVLSNGKVAVFYIGRTRLADIFNDIEGLSPAENPKVLDNLGMGPLYVNPAFDYELIVYDAYDNEMFSVKKYLHSKGEHSTANVVVTPSENIAVSAWRIGDVQVYMPYLTGDVGKTYEGIDPIVVNNEYNRISANHIPLGVQDPLYFVEDSESACIIGMSGGTVPEGTMTESGLGFKNGKITGYNGSAFSAGNDYAAGSYVDITDNTISVTGLQPEGDYAYNSALSSKVDVTALPQDLVHSGDLTAYQPAGNYQTAGNYLSATDSAKFYPMEGNPSGFLTAHQSLQGYATEQWVESKGYLTSVDIPESANWNEATTVVNNNSAIWNNTTNIVSANSAQWTEGSTANPQIPVTGINGIKISESGDKVVFEVSGDYATNAQLADKLDTTALNSNVDPITISYSAKPTDNPIYASGNQLKNVDYIDGKAGLAIVPNGVLQVPNIITAANGVLQVPSAITAANGVLQVTNAITAAPNDVLQVNGVITANPQGLTAAGLSAHTTYGLFANSLTADAYNSGFSAMGISAGINSDLTIKGKSELLSSMNGNGFILSSVNSSIGSAVLTRAINSNIDSPKFEAKNISGAGFSIEASGAKGYDQNGNVTWDVNKPAKLIGWANYQGTAIDSRASGIAGSIIASVLPDNIPASYMLTSAPYAYMNGMGFFACYPDGTKLSVDTTNHNISVINTAQNSTASMNPSDISYSKYNAETSATDVWSLTGSLQKSEIECDNATSAITAIAGSAIGGQGGGELPEAVSAATDYVTANSANIDATVSNVSANSGAWGGSALPISAGPGIKFEMVDNTLVASTQGPILDKITIAGTWNGHEVKQMLQSGIFETNVNSDVIPVNSAYSAASSKWIDPSNSYIQYGSTSNILPSTWVLGATGRIGSLSLLNGIVKVRSNDTTNTQCTAFVTIKWCEN